MTEHATTGQHPEVEEIAALLDGRLEGDERGRVVAHLADCEDCYEVFSETARFLREEEAQGAPPATDSGSPAAPPVSGGAGRLLRPGSGRWRRGGLIGAAVAAAAAAAALLLWNPTARLLGFGSQPTTVAELAGQLPTEDAVRAVGTTWDQHGWPVMRGAGPAFGPEEQRTFQIGVRVVEMDVALAAGDRELATGLTRQLEKLLAAIDLADPLRILYAGDDGIRGRLAAGEPPAALLDLNRQGDQLLGPDEGEDYPGYVDGFWYGLGKWAGAAHLAAVAGDADFFEARRNLRFLHRATDRELPTEVAEPVRRLDELLARDAASRLPEIQRELEILIELAGGGELARPNRGAAR